MNNKGYFDSVDIVLLVAGVITFLLIFVLLPYSSNIERKLYNAQYGTNYSFKEYFFASKLIKDYMDVGKKQRLEIDLNKGEEETDTLLWEVN